MSTATPSTSSTPCDYYASPNGGGNGRMTSSPFRIQDFWTVATPGTALCLLNGVYQGSSNRIVPPSGLSGTAGKFITIRALNDGQVLLDGQHQRVPVSLNGNSWFILEGFNAARSSSAVVAIRGSNNIIRRVVAWDASMTANADVFLLNEQSSVNNLFEDVAGFGTGKNIFSFARMGPRNRARRIWARWEGSTNSNYKRTIQINYKANPYAIHCENCIATWSAESMPESYSMTDSDGNIIGPSFTNYEMSSLGRSLYWFGTGGSVPASNIDAKLLGSLGYVPASTAGDISVSSSFGLLYSKANGGIDLRHVYLVHHPEHPRFSTVKGLVVGGTGNAAANITTVIGSAGNTITDGWTVTALSRATSVSAAPNPWTTTGDGASLCYRWVNGARTTTPLWPWPMNDRIKAATAVAGAYTGPCPGCVGGRRVRTATDVTAQVQALLGTIPQACRTQ
jgi:hypothetical protein